MELNFQCISFKSKDFSFLFHLSYQKWFFFSFFQVINIEKGFGLVSFVFPLYDTFDTVMYYGSNVHYMYPTITVLPNHKHLLYVIKENCFNWISISYLRLAVVKIEDLSLFRHSNRISNYLDLIWIRLYTIKTWQLFIV